MATRNIENCDLLFEDLNELKAKIDEMIGKSDEISEVRTHLMELSDIVNVKMQAVGSFCPEWRVGKGGKSVQIRAEGVPYGSTPM